MTRSILAPATAVLLAFAACAQQAPATGDSSETATTALAAGSALHCSPSANMAPEGRASAYDSTAVPLGDASALVCYGRPQVKGRTIFGGLVPYGKLWRTGANEPTIVHLPVAAKIAGIAVEPGSYALYTVPGESEWTVIVNRSTSQWGIESAYTPEVEAQEVGRATVIPGRTAEPVEAFTIRAVPSGDAGSNLVMEWENAQVTIPVTRS